MKHIIYIMIMLLVLGIVTASPEEDIKSCEDTPLDCSLWQAVKFIWNYIKDHQAQWSKTGISGGAALSSLGKILYDDYEYMYKDDATINTYLKDKYITIEKYNSDMKFLQWRLDRLECKVELDNPTHVSVETCVKQKEVNRNCESEKFNGVKFIPSIRCEK